MARPPHFWSPPPSSREPDFETPDLEPPAEGVIRAIPLGGLGEIGLNMMVYECGEDIVVVDCGQMFPDEEMPGVDLVVADVSYLVERRDRVRAILLTHGHEDHVGGLPHILPQLPVPVFGTPLTLRLVQAKLVEYGLDRSTDFRRVEYRTPARLGCFEATFLHVTHSLVDSASIVLRSPAGTIVHSGDYKIDPAPPDGAPFDFHGFGELGEEGVLALFGDSTNVEMPGHSPSESSVIPGLRRVFAEAQRALIVSTFSSSLHRIQTIFDLAREMGRRVYVTGLNLERNVGIARDMGILQVESDRIASLRDYPESDPSKAVVLTTGSQGEPLSALSLMAHDSHKTVEVREGDTVVLTARLIPGNERSIYRMINQFYRRGAHVVYERMADIHVSGHAYSGEMATLINLLAPRYLVPIHGETRHLVLHRDLGERLGIPASNIPIIENGDVLELSEDGARVRGRLNVSRVMVDGKSVGETGEVVLRDRMRLANDGMIVVIMTIDRSTDKIIAGPEIVSRGFVHMDENEELIDKLRAIVIETFEACDAESKEDCAVIKEEVRRALRRYLRREAERFPMVLPVVTEI